MPRPLFADQNLDELLALAENKYRLEFEEISAGGVSLQILQIADMKERLDALVASGGLADALNTLPLWAKIWPASVILGHCLKAFPNKGASLLEIGAGCGVAGLLGAALGFQRVVVSDINEDALLFARINALKNNLGDRVEVRRIDLENDREGERFSLIIGAEILYLEHLYRPLVKFLQRRLSPSPKDTASPRPEVLLASDHRREAKRFFKLAEKEFKVEHKPIGARASSKEDTEKHLLMLHRLSYY